MSQTGLYWGFLHTTVLSMMYIGAIEMKQQKEIHKA